MFPYDSVDKKIVDQLLPIPLKEINKNLKTVLTSRNVEDHKLHLALLCFVNFYLVTLGLNLRTGHVIHFEAY